MGALKRTAAWFTGFVGILTAGVAVDLVLSHQPTNLGRTVLLAATAGAVSWGLFRSAKANDAPMIRTSDRPVIAQAEARGGQLTVGEAAMLLDVSAREAQRALERLQKAGACTSEERAGARVYDFRRRTT